MEDTATRESAAPVALIAAGGEGKRLGSIGPKALVVCGGKPLLEWCLDAFAASSAFGAGGGRVVVAAHASDLPAFERACAPARAAGLEVMVTEGGPSRSHSVAAALRAAAPEGIVLVHDAARVFTTPELIDALHDSLAAEAGDIAGLIPAAPVVDTIKRVDGSLVIRETPPRDELWAVQTPQAFRAAPLAEALAGDDATIAAATDDASLIESRGGKVKVFAWTEPNGKITTPEDLAAAEERLSRSAV